MSRIANDKYYTDPTLANYCWDKVADVIGRTNISRVIEPSVGSGSFLSHPLYNVDLAYDIEPECSSTEMTEVIKADFLTITNDYVKGQLVIGNPPFGHSGTLAHKFYKKATCLGDYIAFILPISQFHNTQSYHEFDLVYSEDLGIRPYSGRNLHCCFNIYKRPSHGGINSRPNVRSDIISIYRNDTKGYDEHDYDIRMCFWGANAGKILTDKESYKAEYKIKVHKAENRETVIYALSCYPWKQELQSIAQKSIPQYKIYNIINNLKFN